MKHYSVAISLIRRLDLLGINCFCNLNRVDFGCSVFGEIIKGLCMDGELVRAVRRCCFVAKRGGASGKLLLLKDTEWEVVVAKRWNKWEVVGLSVVIYDLVIDGLCKDKHVNEAFKIL
ncbi:hypothetical protein LguiB_027204 [Lonicera macranthoides]